MAPTIFGPYGLPLGASDSALPQADAIDGYENRHRTDGIDAMHAELRGEMDRWRGGMRLDASGREVRLDAAAIGAIDFDGFANELTGIGTWSGDKTMAGMPGGARFDLYRLSNVEAELRWRGSDLGRNIVEKIPDEMTREGWDIEVQPTEEEQQQASDPRVAMDNALRQPARAAAGWRKLAKRARGDMARRCLLQALRWDDVARGIADPAEGAPPPPPGALPRINDEGVELGEAMDRVSEELDVVGVLNQALKYEQAFGGAAILIGADDGQADLTKPLDEKNIRTVRHLTAYTGGWDGEVVAWSYYNDPRKPKFGQPMIYMLRNLGVPLARPPAPGETNPQPQVLPAGPAGPLIFYIHESRFLIFDGTPSTRRSRVEMRGWGDSVFTRCNEVLSHFSQSWNGIAVLMQEYSIAVVKQKGLTDLLLAAAKAKGSDGDISAGNGAVLSRARQLQMSQSICRTRLLDADEEFTRDTTTVSGVSDIMEQFALRLAAAADMPVSMMFGQVKGGLGDAGNTDVRFFYDRVGARQRRRMLPNLKRLFRLLWLAKDSPTRGVLPERWNITLRSLWQMTAKERADLRLVVTQADEIAINTQQVTPEEVAAARYGGSQFNDGTIVLDLESREAMFSRATEAEPEKPEHEETDPADKGAGAAPAAPAAAPSSAPASGANVELTPTTQASIVKVNQALAVLGLPPLTKPDGTPDPDGELTVAQFTAKNASTVAAASAAESGDAPAASDVEPTEEPAKPAAPSTSTATAGSKPPAPKPQAPQSATSKPKAPTTTATAGKPPQSPPTSDAKGGKLPAPAVEQPPLEVPAMEAMPGDPITGDPTGTPTPGPSRTRKPRRS